jgi:hypothetical protein
MSLKSHDGGELRAEDVFFGEPASEIGPLLSGATTRCPERPGRHAGQFVAMAISGLLLGGLIVFGVVLIAAADTEAAIIAGAAAGVALGALFPLLLRVIPLPELCSYVGRDGLVMYERRLGGTKRTLLRFADAATLEREVTEIRMAGVPVGQKEIFTWRDARKRKLVRLETLRDPRQPLVPAWDRWWLAERAADAFEAFHARAATTRAA